MTRLKYTELDCSVARSLQVIGEHWAMLIVKNAFYGTSRFSDFQRLLGVARNILTARLNHLVDAGILERYLPDGGGVRQHYRLTQKGRDLLPVVLALMQWGDRWTAGNDGPSMQLCHRDTGELIAPLGVTDVRGNPVAPEQLTYLPKREGAAAMLGR